ncbi:Inner membrane protein YbaN [hydrothermal vent metagenome]|uniref:Inner membrane protein YbaN n=1 Tax=hydrothermal vent metagenome TaxID=652676 RepID=A0A3B0X040_9ZZZZ
MRAVYFSLGWLFFFIGAVGVILPVLPTTPFMILALWAFSKSSERFHRWLYHHRLFGPPLQQWDKYGVIPLPAKIMSVSFMSISFLYMLVFSPVSFWLKLMIAALMLYGAWFVLSKPSSPPGNINTVK